MNIHVRCSMSYWQFSPIPNIEESNFNKILERFYNLKVAGLIRENIQNSLDGRLLGMKVQYSSPLQQVRSKRKTSQELKK